MTDHDFLSATFQSIVLPPPEPALTTTPLQCDRWIARSALQKAVRRGEGAMAKRAALTLLENDPRSAWRALVIVGLEDVGFGSWTALSEVVALAQSSVRRKHLASEAVLVSHAAQRLASGGHCQAACDLFMRATNDPAWEFARADLADANPSDRRDVLASSTRPLIERAVALLALLNDPDGGPRSSRAEAILEASTGAGPLRSVAHAALRATGNEMALMLPLLANAVSRQDYRVANDELLPRVEHGGIPVYAVDQFTRTGKAAIRRLIQRNTDIRALLESVTGDQSAWSGMVGDALFLVEGSPVNCRVVNDELEHLRHPFRPLLGGFALGEALPALTGLLKRAIPTLNALRVSLLPQYPGANSAPLSAPDNSSPRLMAGASEDRASKFAWGPGEVTIVDAPPRSSELGLVPIEMALAKVEALRPGSHSGAVLNPFEVQPGPTVAHELDSERYTFTKLRVDALKHLCTELDKAKLTEIIRGDGHALPIILSTEAGHFIWREPEAVIAKWLLGDDEVLVRIEHG